jgi:hypothetical protein
MINSTQLCISHIEGYPPGNLDWFRWTTIANCDGNSIQNYNINGEIIRILTADFRTEISIFIPRYELAISHFFPKRNVTYITLRIISVSELSANRDS